MSKLPHIVCYGEILWDVFPDGKKLGGAPLNVALRLHSFGANTSIISALGKDALGKTTLEALKEKDFPTTYIQQSKRPTGQVTVTLDDSGSARYDIQKDAAWDHIAATPEAIEEVKKADAFVFGSLALRETYNQAQFEALVTEAKYTVFDLNLRDPHYDLDVVLSLMEIANCIKLNDEELELIVTLLDLEKESLEEELKAVAKATNTDTVCVTLGPDGAMLYHNKTIYTQVGFPTKVVDTVGAGDSFLAALIFGLISGEAPEDSLEVAAAMGSLVAGKAGANAVVTNDEIDDLLEGGY
ncbi:fructokinase [Dokdonia pacifica]|uniref:Fructokinase n=1 Tax=Dokdonia pacifica TaxID=1627892 RepID=A0A238VT02_9FLAO|nr:carbohydrate kinase [Dokdonia pacifica]GGG17896.1 fructokinase [Dokdonia pacifica]SNR37462.1 fructokinase [Dokdonia pacifica]